MCTQFFGGVTSPATTGIKRLRSGVPRGFLKNPNLLKNEISTIITSDVGQPLSSIAPSCEVAVAPARPSLVMGCRSGSVRTSCATSVRCAVKLVSHCA